MKGTSEVKVKGRTAIKGVCTKCGTNMFKFIAKK